MADEECAGSLLARTLEDAVEELDTALAEMERDRPFIEAAENLALPYMNDNEKWGPIWNSFMTAYRKRREGMKHGE